MDDTTPDEPDPEPAPTSVRAEVESLLDVDDTRMGDVYRLDREGKTAPEIADELGVATSGFVSNYKTAIAALLDGQVPASPTLAAQVASRVRQWLKKSGISPGLREHLDQLHVGLQLRADDSVARSQELGKAAQRTADVEDRRTPGIYVYTLPHYLRYPYEPESGRTLLKVGRSERDTYQRAYSQGRITALPEDPILLRVYRVDEGETATAEKGFHDWLLAADHERSRSLRGGSEWFLTSTRFLDRVAQSAGLEVEVVSELETGD